MNKANSTEASLTVGQLRLGQLALSMEKEQ